MKKIYIFLKIMLKSRFIDSCMLTHIHNRKGGKWGLPNIFFKGLLLFKRLLNFFKLSCQWIFMVRLIGSKGVGVGGVIS